MEREQGSNEMPPGTRPMSDETPAPASAPKQAAPTPAPASSSSSKPSAPTPAPAAAKEDVDMSEPDNSDADAKKQADEIKAQGTVAYKARKFDEAAALYQKAWDTYPKDITYLLNLSGVSSAVLGRQ